MTGLLKEKSEIEKLKKEYQTLAEQNFDTKKTTTQPSIGKDELIMEECEL